MKKKNVLFLITALTVTMSPAHATCDTSYIYDFCADYCGDRVQSTYPEMSQYCKVECKGFVNEDPYNVAYTWWKPSSSDRLERTRPERENDKWEPTAEQIKRGVRILFGVCADDE